MELIHRRLANGDFPILRARISKCRNHSDRGLPRYHSDRNPLEPTLPKKYTKVVLREGSTLQGVSGCPIVRYLVACQLHIPYLVIVCDLVQFSDLWVDGGSRYSTAEKVPWTTMPASRGIRHSAGRKTICTIFQVTSYFRNTDMSQLYRCITHV